MAALLDRLRDRQHGGRGAEHLAEVPAVQRLAVHKELRGHDGCVNTACWSDDGKLLVSGSDDMKVVLWDWQPGRAVLQYPSGHRNNVFQAKMMPESGNGTVVSCAADGQVRVATIPEGTSGARVSTRKLAKHQGRAHKLALEPGSAHCFYSCGEDGEVRHFDLREASAGNRRLLVVQGTLGRAVELHSIDCSALDTHQFCLGGGDEYVRVYDHRKPVGGASPVSVAQPIRRLAPRHMSLQARAPYQVHITCAVFSCSGEVLASYNDEDIYLFASEREAAAGGGRPAAAAQQMERPGAARRGKRSRGSSASDGSPPEGRRGRRPGGVADIDDIGASPPSSAGLSAGSGPEGSMPELEDGESSPSGGNNSGGQGRSGSGASSSDAGVDDSDSEVGAHSDSSRGGGGGVEDIDEDYDGLPSRRQGSAGEEAGGSWRRGSGPLGGGAVLQRYEGHRNAQTVKGVNFMGLGDQFVVSGSDCGHVYIWDKRGGELLTSFKADSQIVNVVQPHPSQPLTLATSGLEDTVRVWTPSAGEAEPPGLEELERMQRNKAGQGRPRAPHVMFTAEQLQLLLVQHRGGRGRPGSGDDSDYAAPGYGSSEEDEGGDGPVECALM